MFEADTTYLWQTPDGVGAKVFCASAPASLSRTQSEFGLACVNEVSASKQSTARLQLTLQRPVDSRLCREFMNPPLTKYHLYSSRRSVSSRPGIRSAESINTYHADMGIYVLVPAFFVSRNTYLPQGSL